MPEDAPDGVRCPPQMMRETRDLPMLDRDMIDRIAAAHVLFGEMSSHA